MLNELVDFINGLQGWDFFFYFWPFFLFDFVRYVLLDLILVPWYMIRRHLNREKWRQARRLLFRERPLVSVIAPGKNEGRNIPRLVDSFTHQTYKHIETVIVDDGSDDDTPWICRRLLRQGKIDRFIRNDMRGGKASAANTAIRHCHGKYVIHLDADSHLVDDAIEQILLPFYMEDPPGAVGGDIRVANMETSLATRVQGIEYLKSLTSGRTVSSQLGILRIISGAFGAFRMDVLHRLGGWDVGPGLDGDLTVKIRKLGLRVVHRPESACYTNTPILFRRLAKQRFRWDRSMVRFRMRKHRDILSPGANFKPLNFVSSVENIFFNLVLNLRWWVYIAQIILVAPDLVWLILVINYSLYTLSNLFEYILAMILIGHGHRRPEEFRLLLYVPLMPLYTGLFLRLVRTYAYLMEIIHKVSYRDRWNPWKVSSVCEREKL